MKRRTFLDLALKAPLALPFVTTSLIGLGLEGEEAGASGAPALPSVTPIRRFAFTSCNDLNGKQIMWKRMLDLDTELFAWLGDNIYADTTDMSLMASLYQKQRSHPEYQKFLSHVPVIGTWDDHDYGANDSGKEYPKKAESQQLFLDFIGDPATSVRRTREGIYTYYDVGPAGQQVRFILLDTRYHRDAPNRKGADMLGAAQWKWLEGVLSSSAAAANVIISSISVLSPKIPGMEQWRNFPASFSKMFQVIQNSRASGVIFLTGDRHFAGFLKDTVGSTSYYEVMSSGVNKAMSGGFRAGVLKRTYGSSNCAFENNFGFLEFDWDKADLELSFTAQGEKAATALKKNFVLRQGNWQLI